MARKDIPIKTQKLLFARYGNRCTYPGCTAVQDSGVAHDTLLVEMAHIHAASPGGPRYDADMTHAARNALDNLILLCPTHHKLVDDTPDEYPADTLRRWKAPRDRAVGERRNAYLAQELLAALVPYSEEAAEVYQALSAQHREGDWPTHAVADALLELNGAFASTVGLLLNRVTCDPTEQAKPDQAYCEHAYQVAYHTLELLCYVLLSHLWAQGRAQAAAAPPLEASTLFGAVQASLTDYAELLTQLLQQVDDSPHLSLPWPELAAFSQALRQPEGELRPALLALEALHEDPGGAFEAEYHLTTLLRPLAFMARLEMVSIKKIDYRQLPFEAGYYLHHVSHIGATQGTQLSTEKDPAGAVQRYTAGPEVTQTLVLRPRTEHSPQQRVALFPFLIDTTTLQPEPEGGARVACLQTVRTARQLRLTYRYVKDQTPHEVAYSGTAPAATPPEAALATAQAWAQWHADTLCQKLQEARTYFTPTA